MNLEEKFKLLENIKNTLDSKNILESYYSKYLINFQLFGKKTFIMQKSIMICSCLIFALFPLFFIQYFLLALCPWLVAVTLCLILTADKYHLKIKSNKEELESLLLKELKSNNSILEDVIKNNKNLEKSDLKNIIKHISNNNSDGLMQSIENLLKTIDQKAKDNLIEKNEIEIINKLFNTKELNANNKYLIKNVI